MGFTLGLAQTAFPADGSAVNQVRRCAKAAHKRGTTLLAFPENLMYPHELATAELADLAEPLDGSFVGDVRRIAQQYGLWIAFTMSEANAAGAPPFNTAVVVSDDGMICGTYRKCHLYDAHNVRESDRMSAGSELCAPIRTPFCTLGLGICYDLRFPEVARHLALAGCNVLLYPAAWHNGANKQLHWKTLLRARAIENECFVAGICHGAERYVRTSHVFDPLGNEIVGGEDEMLFCDVKTSEVAATRRAMPVFNHRKPNIYALS